MWTGPALICDSSPTVCPEILSCATWSTLSTKPATLFLANNLQLSYFLHL